MNEDNPERDDLFWHALNYRGASVDSAEQMWQELVACHERLIAAAVAAERERCAKLCENVARYYTKQYTMAATECAKQIRAMPSG